jgi:hypothetical protein
MKTSIITPVSKALDELNELGFTYDFNLQEDIPKNPDKYESSYLPLRRRFQP